MYIYYDSQGVVKEIITDNLVSGDSGKKIYAYWEGDTSSIDSAWIRYKLANGLYYPSSSTYYTVDSTTTDYIPYNANRDLKFFNYTQTYKFRVFNIPQNVLANATNSILDLRISIFYIDENGTSAPTILNGVVTVPNIETGEIEAMDLVVVGVAPSNSSVSSNENINLAQWNYLIKYIATMQPKLVSGTNIKTINNNSILGSGNIVVKDTVEFEVDDILNIDNDELAEMLDTLDNYSSDYTQIGDIVLKDDENIVHANKIEFYEDSDTQIGYFEFVLSNGTIIVLSYTAENDVTVSYGNKHIYRHNIAITDTNKTFYISFSIYNTSSSAYTTVAGFIDNLPTYSTYGGIEANGYTRLGKILNIYKYVGSSYKWIGAIYNYNYTYDNTNQVCNETTTVKDTVVQIY